MLLRKSGFLPERVAKIRLSVNKNKYNLLFLQLRVSYLILEGGR